MIGFGLGFLILLAVLFPKMMRKTLIVVLLMIGAAAWYTTSYFSERYDHWVACGKPEHGVCPE